MPRSAILASHRPLLGIHLNDEQPALLSPDMLKRHTVIVGQSGSGKSFFLARLLEEILLKTGGRMLALDPNGDLRQFHSPMDYSAKSTESLLLALERADGLYQRSKAPSFELPDGFAKYWRLLRFHHCAYRQHPDSLVAPLGNAALSTLMLHWKFLRADLQEFLLDVDPVDYPERHRAMMLCIEYLGRISFMPRQAGSDRAPRSRIDCEYPDGYGLLELAAAAKQCAERNVIEGFPERALVQNADRFREAQSRFEQIFSSYDLWWDRPAQTWREDIAVDKRHWNPASHESQLEGMRAWKDLGGYLEDFFDDAPSAGGVLDALVVGLATCEASDMHLAADVALDRAWRSATLGWMEANRIGRYSKSMRPDNRVPTFLVIDEAHNFAPEHASSSLQQRVSDRIAQIAAEGRKFGLFLILATQRPQKLRRGLLAECENAALLRIQSELERNFAADTLGLPRQRANQCEYFSRGQCLLSGQWAGGSAQSVQVLPARTRVGGTDVPGRWVKARREYFKSKLAAAAGSANDPDSTAIVIEPNEPGAEE